MTGHTQPFDLSTRAGQVANIKAVRARIAEAARRHRTPPPPPPPARPERPTGPARDWLDISSVVVGLRSQDVWRRIAVAVCLRHGVALDDVLGERRLTRLVLARQEIMWSLHHVARLSYPHIGRLLNRDHTTVLHGVRRHQARIDARAAHAAGEARE